VAAAAHARLEKFKAVQSRLSEIVHRIDRLNGVLLQPSHRAGHIALFRIAGGMLAGPLDFDVSSRTAHAQGAHARSQPQSQLPSHPQSMEARLQQLLQSTEVALPASATEWMEHLAILKRWYYRTQKVGEIFFENERGELPMRRLVRAVGRVLKGEMPAGELSETAKDYWIFRGKEGGLH